MSAIVILGGIGVTVVGWLSWWRLAPLFRIAATVAPSVKVPGSHWVEADTFRYVDEHGVVRSVTGTKQ